MPVKKTNAATGAFPVSAAAAKPLHQNLVLKLEVHSWQSEIQQMVRVKGGVSWASCFYLYGVPSDRNSDVSLCRIGFYSDERPMKPSYANSEIRIYYPFSVYRDILALLSSAKKIHVGFREKPNGEIDAWIGSDHLPVGRKKKK